MIRVECLGVLFDLDGVLIDSNPAVDRVWNVWAARHGFNADEVIRKAHGRPSLTTVREYIAEELALAEHEGLVRAEIADIEGIVPMPGALSLLDSILAERWAIVTSGTYELATTRIKAAGLPMPKNLITASDITHGKPNPEPYIKGAALLGIPARDCVVVEDAGAGVRAGKAAGARVIGVRGPTESEETLRAAGAEWLVDSCADVTAEQDLKSNALVLLIRAR
jgi:mannitol-1-/sugar-/sorbitol-6-phosphatase